MPPAKKPPSSYAVFMQHVTYVGESEQLDVSGIISLKCFNDWYSTRSQKIHNPAQSFQRIIYAHIRGADRRKPFPPLVEREMLKIVRNKDKRVKLFQTICPNSGMKLGRCGFKHLGYHESKAMSEVEENKKSTDSNDVISINTNKTIFNYGFKLFDDFISEFCVIGAMKKFNENKALSRTTHSTSNWEKAIEVFCKYLPLEVVFMLDLELQKANENPKNPALYFILNQEINPSDLRFRAEFLLPSLPHQFFRPSKLLGRIVFLGMNGVVVEQNEEAERIVGKSIIGFPHQILEESLILALYATIFYFPILYETGQVWSRGIFRCKGVPRIVLIHKIILEEKQIMHFQDVSSEFPGYSEWPMFA